MAKPNFQLIWGETAPSVPIPAPSYAAGWDAYLGSTPPLGSDHDYVMNQHDIKLAYLNEQGIAEWDAITAYPEAAYVKGSDGEIYRSTAPTTGNDPIAGGPWILAIVDTLNTVRQDVASAATVVLPTTTRHVNITGTTAITAFTIAAGNCYFVRFAGAATLTNNASIVTQTGANIVAAAGDTCLIRATATDVVEVLCYTKDTRGAGEYIEILPDGSYTSGTYAIPGGRQWSDFSLLFISGRPSTGVTATTGGSSIVTSQHIALNPTTWGAQTQWSSSNNVTVKATSATQFSVTVVGGSTILTTFCGYLKPGVV